MKLSTEERTALLQVLEDRFSKNPSRHKGQMWSEVANLLESNPDKLWAIQEMERTGGQPDVIMLPDKQLAMVDCSPESPEGRRSLCFDRAALDARKANKPEGSALELAEAMGVELLTEAEYRHLQTLGEFDLKTSSWIQTPPNIRKLGGALFCDRRYDTVFVFHNGADSYYASRGFRAAVRLQP